MYLLARWLCRVCSTPKTPPHCNSMRLVRLARGAQHVARCSAPLALTRANANRRIRASSWGGEEGGIAGACIPRRRRFFWLRSRKHGTPTHPPTHTHPSNSGGKQAGGNVVLGSRSRIILIGAGNGHCRIFLIFVVIVAQGLYICGDASTPVLIEEFDAGWVGSIYGIPCLQLIEAFAHQVQRIRFGE